MAHLGEDLREQAEKGDADAVMKILLSGVNVNDQNRMNGMTALHWACVRGHSQIAQLLQSHGADLQIPRHDGRTPLDLCTSAETLKVLNVDEDEAFRRLQQCHVPALPITPNYITYRPFPYISNDSRLPQTEKDDTKPSANTSTSNLDTNLLLKVRIAPSALAADDDFVEVEIPSAETQSLEQLTRVLCGEMEVPVDQVVRIRKLPNVRLRNDADVKRLQSGIELEIVLKT